MNKDKNQGLLQTSLKYGLRILIAFLLVGVLGFFVLPPFVKSTLLEKLGEALHRPVAVKSVSINPYALTVTLDGVSIKERDSDETFAGFDSLYLNLELSSLFRGGPVLNEIRLVNPQFKIVRLSDKRYNFSDLLDEFMSKPKSNDPTPAFSLNNIQVSGGRIEFDDRPVNEKHEVSDINLTLPFVSSMAYATKTFVEPAFSARVDGAPLEIKGKSKPFDDSLESEVVLALEALPLARFVDYVPFKLPITMPSGALNSDLKFSFIQYKDKPSSLKMSGSVAINKLRVNEGKEIPLLSFDSLRVNIASTDLLARSFVIDSVLISSPEVHARMGGSRYVNWVEVMRKNMEADQKPVAKEGAVTREAPLAWTLGELSIDQGKLIFEDHGKTPAAVQRIEKITIQLKDLSSADGHPTKLAASLILNSKGAVTVSGDLTPNPLRANLDLDIKTIELLPLQPYFAEKLNIAVTRGEVTLKGNLKLSQEATPKAEVPPFAGGFAGQLMIGNFQAVDKANSTDFLRWKSLFLSQIEANLGPDSISVGEIALADFFARVIISPEGKLNLLQIVRKDEKPAGGVSDVPAPESAETAASGDGKAVAKVEPRREPLMPLKIGKVTLQGGSVRFTDNFVKPNYTANLMKIGGRITGLSTDANSVASIELRGNYDNVAPLNLAGQLNPLATQPKLDIQADIKGIEMTSFSPYSGKYAGYSIAKGKLSLFIKYKIEDNLLEAENRVFLDQLTFGDPVDSPDATKLPVTLAVALLKNRNGEIDLNLPISGSLNDPQFSIGGLIVKVIVNLFVKAVTSPFALLGSLFGSGEEMSNVEFDAGRAAITPAAQTKLENLTKALIDRPALKLEIEGRVDIEQDREGLKSARIDRKVRALKREELTKKGVETGAADSVEVTPQEYPALLERVYRDEKFPKPRNMVGLVKSLPVEEMEKLIITHSTVDEEDLRALGDRRAKAVRDWLLAHEIPAERVFLLPTKLDEGSKTTSEDKAKAKGSRADFSLK